MFNLSETQKIFVNKIIAEPRDHNSIASRYILSTILDVCVIGAIEWDTQEKKSTVYYGGFENSNAESVLKMMDCFALLRVLEEEGYIFILHTQDDIEKKCILRYNVINSSNDVIVKSEYSWKYDNGVIHPLTGWQTSIRDYYILYEKYINSVAFPTQKLLEYVNSGFQTEEQRQFAIQLKDSKVKFETQLKDSEKKHNEAMGKAQKSLRLAWGAFIVALLSTLSGLSNVFCPDMKIKELNESLKLIHSDIIKLSNDTVKTISSTHILPIEQEEEKVKTEKE